MNETNTIQPRKWYYLHSGYAGNSSILVSPFEKTGNKDGGYYNVTAMMAGKMNEPTPMVDEWRAIGLDGRIVTISANDLDTAGRIGIGTIEFRPDAKLYLNREDAARLLKTDYTEEEISATFGTTWKDGYEAGQEATGDLTDKMIEMLKALKAVKVAEKEAEKEAENRKYLADLAECKRKYAYLPCKKTKEHAWLRTGEVSRNLRAMLKVEFPGVKFSVSSNSYSGGDSARVKYVDGPAYGKVNRVVGKFGTKNFDGMQDLEEDCSTAFNDVAGGFSYVHLYRDISDGIRGKVRDLFVEKGFGKYGENDLVRMVSDVCEKTDFDGRAIVDLKYVEKDEKGNWVNKWVIVFKADEKPTGGDDKPTAKVVNGVEVTENKAKHGIEIRFAEKPAKEVLDGLKANGWRWTRFGGCWYNRATDENRTYAEGLAKMVA